MGRLGMTREEEDVGGRDVARRKRVFSWEMSKRDKVFRVV